MNQEEIQAANDDWIQRTWRPAVGVTYIVINVFDFIIFPILWSAFGVFVKGELTPWKPLTLEATGLFHLAFGAILGVAAWSRGQEKLHGVDVNRYGRNYYNRSSNYEFDDVDEYDQPSRRDEPTGRNSSVFRGEQ